MFSDCDIFQKIFEFWHNFIFIGYCYGNLKIPNFVMLACVETFKPCELQLALPWLCPAHPSPASKFLPFTLC